MQFDIADITNYCGSKSYEKGKECASSDYFLKLFIQDNAIFGLYQGTVGTYRVNLVFNKNMPSYSWCTCPAMAQHDDKCKHIAGLMILWKEESEEFEKLKSWDLLLGNKDKKELLKIIKKVAGQSIDMTNALYEELCSEQLIDYEEMYDPDDEW
jgi:uncharacterized Zn finger protein